MDQFQDQIQKLREKNINNEESNSIIDIFNQLNQEIWIQ